MSKILFSPLPILLCIQNALAQAPVLLAGPVPAVAPNYAVGSTTTITYSVTNNVTNQSFPLSITGLSTTVRRVTVANDCGKTIPPGPSTCKIGLQIAPSKAGKIKEILRIDYQGRLPFLSKIGFTAVRPASVIYTNAKVQTIDSRMSTAQAVAIRGTKIIGVGTDNAMVEQFRGPRTTVTDLKGAAILPGFIASHYHALGWGSFTNSNWIDVSSVNVMLKPPVNDPRCVTKTDPQKCFIPVKSQADVNARIQKALNEAPTQTSPVYFFNYDPSRLGHGTNCNPANGVAFQCDNFEDGHARETLDAMSTTNPILITSESGHIVYVNTPYLTKLNICGTDVAQANCIQPIYSPEQEMKMANLGQLNEDLALYAEGVAALEIGEKDPAGLAIMLKNAIAVMQQHGFTLIQEGAANKQIMDLWAEVSKTPNFPVKVALLAYEVSPTVDLAVKEAQEIRAANLNNPNVFIAAVKMFADGSNQGYTSWMLAPYYTVYPPFTNAAIFDQPYMGIFDSDQSAITAGALTAHKAHFPLAIHQNGDSAIQNAINGLKGAGTPPSGVRDIMIHLSFAHPEDIDAVIEMGVGSTFLMENVYYYGLPLCQQVMGPKRTSRIYPAGTAVKKGLRFGLHSDTPVTPPYPLFAVWVAKTRTTQQPSWYPNRDPARCPIKSDKEAISIAQGIKAFTIDAAWIYGLDKEIGSIEVGKNADFVFLSADPLAMENNPDGLKNIRTLATVYRGKYFANPKASENPIWPE